MKSTHEHAKAPFRPAFHISRKISDFGINLLGGIEVIGVENIQQREAAYVQSYPHFSMLDIPALGVGAYEADKQHLRYMGKKELNKFGIGRWMAWGGGFFIDRELGLTAEQYAYISDLKTKKAAIAVAPQGHRYNSPLEREQFGTLVIAPMVFLNDFEVVPVGLSGTEPGDVGCLQVGYGSPLSAEKVDFEVNPDWDPRTTQGKISQAIKQAKGPRAMKEFVDSLFQATVEIQHATEQRRQERLQESGYTWLASRLNRSGAKASRPPKFKR